MKMVVLAAALVLLFAAPVLAADQQWDSQNYPGYDLTSGYYYTFESLVQHGYGWPAHYYYYYLQNDSTNHDITAWTWTYGTHSGSVFPHPAGAESVGHYAGDGNLPLERGNYSDRYEDNDSVAAAPILVVSNIAWENGHVSHENIYIPSNLVPEPTSLMALAFGMIGAVGSLLKRRS